MSEVKDGISYRSACPDDYRLIWDLLCEIGWGKYISDYERFCRMLSNSNRTIVALEHSRIAGFARALCDDASVGYITMVAVAKDRQGKGIGKQMVNMLIGDDPDIKWVLTTAADSVSFWESMGFKVMESAMVKQRAVDLHHEKTAVKNITRNLQIKDRLFRRIRKICHCILS